MCQKRCTVSPKDEQFKWGSRVSEIKRFKELRVTLQIVSFKCIIKSSTGHLRQRLFIFWFHLLTHAREICKWGKVIILQDLIAKRNPCISSPLTFRGCQRLASRETEGGERASKRVVSVLCRGSAGVTDMQDERSREFDWFEEQGKESFPPRWKF